LKYSNTKTSQQKTLIILFKYVFMVIGMAVLGLGLALTVQAELGLASWSVLHKALENITFLTFGQASQLVGVVVITVSWFLGKPPQFGTFLNILLVGWFTDLFRIYIISSPDRLFTQAIFLLSGIVLTGLGVGMYLSADVGAGPRDSLMLALNNLCSWNLGKLRTTMEVTAMLVGWFLGGPIGVGTVVGSLLLGPSVQYSLRLFMALENIGNLSKFIHVPIKSKETQGHASSAD